MLQTAPTLTIEAAYPERDWAYRSTVLFLRVAEQMNAGLIGYLRPFEMQYSDYRYLSRNRDLIPPSQQASFEAADMVVRQAISTDFPLILAGEDPGFRLLKETHDRLVGNCKHPQRPKIQCIDCPKIRCKP